jgi:hypothetical protein
MSRIQTLHYMLLVLLAMCLSPNVAAQPNEIERLYGQGVHAYHSGLLEEALLAFDQAVGLGARDPRIFYYRGAVQDARGFADGASADFMTGAQLEYQSQGRFYSVGRALERVQGVVRLQIENARNNARLVAMQQSAPDSGNPLAGQFDAVPVVPDPLPVTAARPAINFPDTTGQAYPNTPFDNTAPATDDPASVPPTGDGEMPPGGDNSDDSGSEDDGQKPADESGEKSPEQDDPFGENPDSGNDKDDAPEDSGENKPEDDDPFGDGN